MSLKLEQLQHLVAIVEHGSLRAAARRLNLPQPSLTRSIRALERELGVELFVRAAQGMALTSQGRQFHLRASSLVHELRRAREELTQDAGDERGHVIVALSIMPHVGMLPRALPAFRRRYPQVTLQLIEGLFPDVEERLRTGLLDFYLGAAPREEPASGLKVQRLFENQRTVVARKGHPLARARSLAALREAEWATTAIDFNAEQDLEGLFARHGLSPPRVVLQARTALSLIASLTSTDLLAMVPMQWEDFAATQGTLQPIHVREHLPAPDMVLVTRHGLPLTPAAEHLCDLLLREVPRQPPSSTGPANEVSQQVRNAGVLGPDAEAR
jgi:LysR family transcriptional regulator, regulator of abg operon